ncbi:MAG: hypothetical protein M0Q95_01980 [Porticoccaceae bacterium]|nr:hypothetical protein [Porticoccaceae bacterium]
MNNQGQQQPKSATTSVRLAVALALALLLCAATIIPFVLAINHFDWGVGLLLMAPPLVWVLMRGCRALERWARRDSHASVPVDPDFPD